MQMISYRRTGRPRLRGDAVQMHDPRIEPLGRRILRAEGAHEGRAACLAAPCAAPEQP